MSKPQKNLVGLSSQLQLSASSRLAIETSNDLPRTGTGMRKISMSSTRTPSPSPSLENVFERKPAPRDLPPLPVKPSASNSFKGDLYTHAVSQDPFGSHKVVPTRVDESSTLIQKLNHDHARVWAQTQEQHASTSGGEEAGRGTGLFQVGLDEHSLVSAGLPPKAIDRLYRGLHNYTFAFRDLIDREIAQASNSGDLKSAMVHEFGLLLSMIKSDLLSDAPKEEMLKDLHDKAAQQQENGDVGAKGRPEPSQEREVKLAANNNNASLRMPSIENGAADNSIDADGVDIILRAKGTFELRNQVLQRLLLEERQQVADHANTIGTLENKNQELHENMERMREDMAHVKKAHEEQVEHSKSQQEWFDKTLQEHSYKLSQSHDTIRNLQAKMKEEDRKTAAIASEKQELFLNLQETVSQRDDFKSSMISLKEKLVEAEHAVKAQYEKFKDDIERVEELQNNFETAIEERDVARELYDEEAGKILKMKDELEEKEDDKSKLNTRILALQKTLKDRGSELENEKLLSAGLKEEIKRLSHCESDLADTKMNLSYALDITEMKQREGEKQRLYTEDLWAKSKGYLEEARRKHVKLNELNIKLEAMLREKHEEVRKLKDSGKVLEDRAVASEEQAKSLQNQYEVALDGRARAEAAAEELERNLKDVTKKNWKLEEKLEEFRTDLRDTKRQNTKFEAHAQMLNQKLKETQERETKKEAKFQADMKKSNKQISNLKKQVEEMTPKVKQLDKMKKSLEELQEKHAALTIECDTWHKKFTSCNKEKLAYKQKFDNATTTIAELTTTLNTLEKMNKLLQTNKEENEERIKNLVQEVNTLTGARDQLTDDLKEARELLSTSQTNLGYEMEGNVVREEQLAEALDKLEALTDKYKKAEIDKRNMTTKIRTLRSSNEELRSKFENTIDRFHAERRAWLDAVNQARGEFSKMWNDIRDDLSSRSEVIAVAGQVNENLANTTRLLQTTDAFSTYEVISDFKDMIKEETTQVKVVTKKTKQEKKSAAIMLKMQRAADLERKKKMKEEQAKQLELMKKQYEQSANSASVSVNAVAKEQLMKREKQFMEELASLQERLDKALQETEKERKHIKKLDEEIKALEIEKERLSYQNDELQTNIERKERLNSEMLDEANSRVEHLTLQLSNANRSRIWKEKYAQQLNDQLKRARYELMQLGRQPTLVTKCIQTQYCDLWALNVLTEPERNEETRQSWTNNLVITPHIEIMSLQKLIDMISKIFADKLLADLSAVRAGKEEYQLVEFVYDFFFDKYGLEDLTMKYLTQLGASLLHHQKHPTVRVFAGLCDILPKDNNTQSKLQFQKDATTVMESKYLYGIDWEKTLLAFNHRLALQVSKVVPDNIFTGSSPLVHSMTNGFMYEVTQMPFMREILHVCKGDNLFNDLSSYDLGIPLSEQQLPQLYRLLVEACDILKVDVPEIFINGNSMWDCCLICPGNDKPFMIITTPVIESLQPKELQVVMAQQLLPLVDKSFAPLINACSLSMVASELFLTRDIARAQWSSAVVPTVIRLQQAIDLTADRIALIVAQDFDLVISTMMKLNVSSDTLGNQMNPEMLLEQADAVGSAASKFLNRYDEKVKNLAVQGGTRKLFSTRQDLECSTDLKNVAHASLSMSLVSCSNSLSMLRARELGRWKESSDFKNIMENSRPYNVAG